jgi:tRNA A-37 threonylcarbamoyl transferase component Bud32
VLQPDFRLRLAGRDRFDDLMAIEGEVYRAQARRRTVHFVRDGKGYFIKQHFGSGWREIFKNLLYLRLPILGAQNEYRAIQRLHELGVATMTIAGYGSQGWNPAQRKSFIVTEALNDTETLEDLTREWKASPPTVKFKRALTLQVAEIARRLHENGVNHRDFYLCHFRLDKLDPHKLYLIDLHRAQLRSKTPRRWITKDLGGLYFSSMEIGLTKRDLLRFMKAYRRAPLKKILARESRFWREVQEKALKLYRQ